MKRPHGFVAKFEDGKVDFHVEISGASNEQIAMLMAVLEDIKQTLLDSFREGTDYRVTDRNSF